MNLSKEMNFATLLSSCKTTGEIIEAMKLTYDLDYKLSPVDKIKIVAALTGATFLPKKK